MKKYIPAVLALSLFACTETTQKEDAQSKDDTAKHEESQEESYTVDLNLKSLSQADLPKGVEFADGFVSAESWTDKLGTNIIVRSILHETPEKEPEYDDREVVYGKVHAYHYVIDKDGKATLLWDMNDAERQCDFDLSIDFRSDKVIVTDVDSNDIAETAVVYSKACRSDVSPEEMKVIMHEGETKYALRGSMFDIVPHEIQTRPLDDLNFEKTGLSEDDPDFDYFEYFGRYMSEKDFEGADERILDHARKVWLRYASLQNDNK